MKRRLKLSAGALQEEEWSSTAAICRDAGWSDLRHFATGALALTDVSTLLAGEQDPVRRETADLITGPFYSRVKPRDRDADLTLVRGRPQRAAGQLVQLSGRITNLKGEPLRNARDSDLAGKHARTVRPSIGSEHSSGA